MPSEPSPTFLNVRVVIAVAILLVASAFSSINRKDIPAGLPFKLIGIEEFRPDGRLDFLVQARAMKPFLPSRGLVGYVTDDLSSMHLHFRFLIMQHALAPLYIDRNNPHPYIVGNFLKPPGSLRITPDYDLETVRDFGDGLILFRNRR
jgi:hypothetical protein